MNEYTDLAESIRKGSEGLRQLCNGEWFLVDDGRVVAACAIGAAIAYKARQAGIPLSEDITTDDAIAYFPVLADKTFHHLSGAKETLINVIIPLNDSSRFSFDELASWVETQGRLVAQEGRLE